MSDEPTIIRCVDPVCGLVQHRLYRFVRKKVHPITGQTLGIVREWPDGANPMPSDPEFGYLEIRFERVSK